MLLTKKLFEDLREAAAGSEGKDDELVDRNRAKDIAHESAYNRICRYLSLSA